MKKIDNYTNRYSLSKTLKFKLIPMGETEKCFNEKYLDGDIERSADYITVKNYMDNYHKLFIEKVLAKAEISPELLESYYNAFLDKKADEETIESIKDSLRASISSLFTLDEYKDEFKKMFDKEMITELLPTILTDEQLSTKSKFDRFTTYFTGFNQNRMNIYSSDNKHSTIAYRLIDENLPKYANNISSYKKIAEKLDAEAINELNNNMKKYDISTVLLEDITCFNRVLSQTNIDLYNRLLGGYSLENGTKIKGLNEYINLYNQVHEKKDRLPLLIPLYKQVLSDRDVINYIDSFKKDEEVLASIEENHLSINTAIDNLGLLINDIELYQDGVAVDTNYVTDYSNAVYGSWDFIINGFISIYGSNSKRKNASEDDIAEEYTKIFKKRKSYLLEELEDYAAGNNIDLSKNMGIASYISNTVKLYIENYKNSYASYISYDNKKDLVNNDSYVAIIKEYLDSIKVIERFIKSLSINNIDGTMNDNFYSELIDINTTILSIDQLYNKVRNYITKKPYSDDKIKLNFDNPQFLGGWDRNKERDYRSVLLRDDKFYYLAVMDKTESKVFLDYPSSNDSFYEKMDYKLLPGPNKMLPKVFFAKSNLDKYNPSAKILDIYKKGSFKKGKTFNSSDLAKLIDFYKQSISIHPDWSSFGFEFKDTKNYKDISQFYNDISNQGYSVKFSNISKSYVDGLVAEGKLYLFKIYNKDFSNYSKGNPNLHTMYFKMLFNPDNLKDVVYKLNGECEMFYRKSSLKYSNPTHPANNPIANKNPNNEKKTSVFAYDLIKDKRYTENQFFLHLPITMNYKEKSNSAGLNLDVKQGIKDSKHNYIIGIDRGERNLIYVCVIDETGKIVEQESMNTIVSGNNYSVDYHNMLDKKEKERQESRQNWKTVNNIKEIKEGYLSQVVHKICEYVVKYDALISLENLNSGFKNSRIKVEKQVYSKFEKMLMDKLSYLVIKNKADKEAGGLLKAYQLTSPDVNDNAIQNGIVFHVPAWLTSKIDPTTGFADLLKVKYKSIDSSKEFISKFDSIAYNSQMNFFEFSFAYDSFGKTPDYRNNWTLCTYGDRIETFRNKDKNSQWDNKEINLTVEFKNLFNKYSINYNSDLKNQLLAQTDKDFFVKFTHLLKMTLQLRNSVTGNIDIDYIISPVKNSNGGFYDSRVINNSLPADADANGAYNIARKLLMLVNRIQESKDLAKVDMTITNEQWLEYVQNNE